jgi:hypothetical protein
MSTYEVEADLIVYCKVKVTVEAEGKDEAIEAAAKILPSNFRPDAAKEWKAKVELKAPKGVNIRVVRAYQFDQASGGEKARKIT